MQRNSLKRYACSAALLSLMAFYGCAPHKPSGELRPWSTFLNNDARTNVTEERVELPLGLAWDKDVSASGFLNPFPKEQLSSPAVSGGVLYAGSTNGLLYAFDVHSGRFIWKLDAGNPIDAPPAVTEKHLFIGSSGGVVRCVDRGTGVEVWRFSAKSEILSSPVVRDGRVFFSSSDDRLYGLDEKTGVKLWSYSRPSFQVVTPRVYTSPAYSNDRLFHLFSDGTLSSVDPATGKELWSKKMVKEFKGAQQTRRTPLADNGVVYIIDDSNSIIALKEANGEAEGKYDIIKAYDFVLADRRTLVIAGADQAVAVDRLSGALLWKKTLEHGPVSTILATEEHLFLLTNYMKPWLGIDYFARPNGYFEIIRLKDGVSVWGKHLESSVTANALAAEGKVALLTNKGTLEVYSAR